MVCSRISNFLLKYPPVWAILANVIYFLQILALSSQIFTTKLILNAKDAQPLITDNHDYIILLYLGCMTSSGQMDIPKLYNSISFGPNKNWFGQFDQTIKRSISTKGIRNWGNFEPSILVAQSSGV